jgi:membrane protease YdiL (CAAX protease family)
MNANKIFRNCAGHFRAVWRIAFYLVLTIGIYSLVNLFTASLLFQGEELSDYTLLVNRFIERIILFICVLIPGLILLKWFDKRPLRLLGLGLDKKAVTDLLFGMIISIVIMVISALVLSLFGLARFTYNGLSEVTLLYFLFSLIVVFIMAAYEEVLFRGYAFQALIEGSNIWIALVIYSLLFGAAHLSNEGVTVFDILVTIVGGAFLGIIYYKTRSLWMCIGAHFIWNWMYGVFFGFYLPAYLKRSVFTYHSLNSGMKLNSDEIHSIILNVLCIIAMVIIWKSSWIRPTQKNRKLWSKYS